MQKNSSFTQMTKFTTNSNGMQNQTAIRTTTKNIKLLRTTKKNLDKQQLPK